MNPELSFREKQVVELVCKGLSNQQIAELMAICRTTVKFHLTNIFKKKDVTNRYQLISKISKVM